MVAARSAAMGFNRLADAAYDALMAMGARAVPVTVIGDRVIIGFDRAKLREALETAGGGS